MAGHLDLGERIITAAMTGAIDTDVAERLIELHTLVTRTITCPVTGEVLDSRTAHLLSVARPQGQTLPVVVAPSADPDIIASRLALVDVRVTDRFDPTAAWAAITNPAATRNRRGAGEVR